MFKNYFQGSLFAQDLLDSSIAEFPEWKAYDDHDLATFESEVQSLFDRFPTDGSPNKTQTEDDLQLADAIFKAAPAASLSEVRSAALILFYHLVFILYAEDRDSLPVRDAAYDDYSLRRVRDDVGKRKKQGDIFFNDERTELQARDGAGRSYNHSGPRLPQDAAYDRRGTIGGQAV